VQCTLISGFLRNKLKANTITPERNFSPKLFEQVFPSLLHLNTNFDPFKKVLHYTEKYYTRKEEEERQAEGMCALMRF
jgi:hypothetical protein